jgi:hypothetical protein
MDASRAKGASASAPQVVEGGADHRAFRPLPAMRWFAWGCAGACCVAAIHLVISGGSVGARALLVCILLAPLLGALAAHRRSLVLHDSGLEDRCLFSTRLVPWEAIVCVDVRRGDVVIRSDVGCVGAGWIGGREDLCRTVVERAGLSRTWAALPLGVQKRYVRRTAGGQGEFLPHNLRTARGVHQTRHGEGGPGA